MTQEVELPSGWTVRLPTPINFVHVASATLPINLMPESDIRALYQAMADDQVARAKKYQEQNP